jgi:hypothetical protein
VVVDNFVNKLLFEYTTINLDAKWEIFAVLFIEKHCRNIHFCSWGSGLSTGLALTGGSKNGRKLLVVLHVCTAHVCSTDGGCVCFPCKI